LEWLAVFADRMIALVDGAILADGTPAEVLTEDRLLAHGVGQTRYTMASRRARDGGRWPEGRRLAVTLEEATIGFGME